MNIKPGAASVVGSWIENEEIASETLRTRPARKSQNLCETYLQ